MTPRVRHPRTGTHEPVERLSTWWEISRGAIGRTVTSGLWFDFADTNVAPLHMLGVTRPLVAVWIIDDTVRQVRHLRPWVGAGIARASDVLELPVDSPLADVVGAGDELLVK
jgi:uncharacterized membrane protein (UPF0127 family)